MDRTSYSSSKRRHAFPWHDPPHSLMKSTSRSDSGIVDTRSLSSRGQERNTDLGTLIFIGIDAEKRVAVIELHDPQRFNTMDSALGDDMAQAVNHLRRLGWVHALTMQGAGSVFCAGGNPFDSSTTLSFNLFACVTDIVGRTLFPFPLPLYVPHNRHTLLRVQRQKNVG